MRKAIKPLLLLLFLFTPITVHAVTYEGVINFVGSGGGNVTFGNTFTTYQLGPYNGLNQFTNLVWLGRNYNQLGFDAGAGVNMTITGITPNSLTYIVATAAPAGTTRVYFLGHGEPSGSNGATTVTYQATTQITTVVSPPGIVRLEWSQGEIEKDRILGNMLTYLGIAALIPVVATAVILKQAAQGEDVNFGVVIGVIVSTLVLFVIVAAIINY